MQENLEKNIDSEKDKNEKNEKKSEDSNQKENDNPDKVDKNKNGKEEDNNNIEKKEIEKNGKDKKEKKEEKEEKEEKVEKEEKEEDKDSLNNDTDNKKSSSNSIKDEEDSLGDFVSNSENKEDDSGEGEDEENDDEDDIDEDDDDDDDDEDDDKTDNTFSDDKKKKDPYHSYINSKVENFIYFDDLEKGDYLYGIEQNKYYKIININSKSGNKCDKYYISLELIDNLKKTKKEKIKMKKISDNIIYKALNYDNNKNENKTKDKKEEEKKDISNKELTTNTNNDDNIIEKKGEIKKENKNEEKKKENENKNEIKNENGNENDKQCNDELSNHNIKKKSNIDDKVLVKDNEKEIENKIENKNENKNESKNENKNENKNESKNESKNEIKENKQDTKEENNKENNKVDKNENIIENNKDKKENKDDDNNKENEKIKNDKKKNNEDPDESNKKLNIKKASNKKNITVSISMKDYLKYTFLQKINIFYINYLNIFHKIDMIININCSINDIIIKFQRLYHIPCDRYSDEKPPLIVFINNKKFSTSNKTRKKYFTPNKFDYKNDYIIILEKENHKFEEIDMGTRNNYINLKGVKIPHFVFSSYYNLQVQSFIISKNLPFLECEVYEVKKELYFNIDPENEKNTKKKVKEFLDLNWKERANLISVIKSGNIRKSKENYDANCFEINRKFILSHGKIYIFLVTSSNKKVYAFNPRHITKDGVVIISKDDKALLSGFKAKKISDFIAYN